MRTLPQFLRNLADTLEGCEWNHPLGSAAKCREAADLLAQSDPITPEVIANVAELHGELREQAEEIKQLQDAVRALVDGWPEEPVDTLSAIRWSHSCIDRVSGEVNDE